jgi:phosphoglycerate dehydrogenase-like enzyme
VTPNTILSAHRAGSTLEVYHAIGRMVVDDLELILRGLPPQHMQQAAPDTVARLRSKIGMYVKFR